MQFSKYYVHRQRYSFAFALVISVAQSTNMVEMRRIELLTPCVQGKCSPS